MKSSTMTPDGFRNHRNIRSSTPCWIEWHWRRWVEGRSRPSIHPRLWRYLMFATLNSSGCKERGLAPACESSTLQVLSEQWPSIENSRDPARRKNIHWRIGWRLQMWHHHIVQKVELEANTGSSNRSVYNMRSPQRMLSNPRSSVHHIDHMRERAPCQLIIKYDNNESKIRNWKSMIRYYLYIISYQPTLKSALAAPRTSNRGKRKFIIFISRLVYLCSEFILWLEIFVVTQSLLLWLTLTCPWLTNRWKFKFKRPKNSLYFSILTKLWINFNGYIFQVFKIL